MGAMQAQLNRTEDFEFARKITETCIALYTESLNGLGGEKAHVFNETIVITDQAYFLRPEVIESVFYMWRYTHEEKYRSFGAGMINSLELKCRNDVAYHVLDSNGQPKDIMHSFFIAETLKYLYLLFVGDEVISCN